MKVLIGSSEVHPFSKTGGLADMVGAMTHALASQGVQVSVVTPLYRGVRPHLGKAEVVRSEVPFLMGQRNVHATIVRLRVRRGLQVLFVDQPAYFDRAALYMEEGRVYADNGERFIFFSKVAAWIARELIAPVDLVHMHDWQAALVPLLVHHEERAGGWAKAPKCCLTIHNLAYQGQFPVETYPLCGLPWDYFRVEGLEFYGGMNCLKAGIRFADYITTVSPRYAREICTPEYGCGLDGVLRERAPFLSGILNGVDYDEWNTTRNPHLEHPYSAHQLAGKRAEKTRLQDDLGLDVDRAVPLFGNISRLVEQKGSDLLLASLEEMLPSGLQFVLLGSGDPSIESAFSNLARRHPRQVSVTIGYDNALAHRIEAASDFYVMPSRFEPCGLNQMYSLRYGSVPIVRATGGLDDSVIDATEQVERANGIKFKEASPRALSHAIRKALILYEHPDVYKFYQQNAMHADFSWKRTVEDYLKIYRRILRRT